MQKARSSETSVNFIQWSLQSMCLPALERATLNQWTGGPNTECLPPLERANLNHWTSGTNRVGVSLPSLEEGNRYSFRNVVSSSYLEFRTRDTVQNPSDLECKCTG
jgi:hypothetical protein